MGHKKAENGFTCAIIVLHLMDIQYGYFILNISYDSMRGRNKRRPQWRAFIENMKMAGDHKSIESACKWWVGRRFNKPAAGPRAARVNELLCPGSNFISDLGTLRS